MVHENYYTRALGLMLAKKWINHVEVLHPNKIAPKIISTVTPIFNASGEVVGVETTMYK